MSMRRACLEAASLLRRQTRNLDLLHDLQKRGFASLPEDISNAARQAKFPARRHLGQPSHGAAAAADAAAGTSSQAAAKAVPINNAQEGAKIATAWMFPWERRQLEGGTGGLRTWEKLYWGVFVVAISFFLFNRLRETAPEEPEIDTEAIERRKEEHARIVLAGATALVPWGEEDPFEGMSPKEVQEYIEKIGGLKDPYEGMDPDEIDAYVKLHGKDSK